MSKETHPIMKAKSWMKNIELDVVLVEPEAVKVELVNLSLKLTCTHVLLCNIKLKYLPDIAQTDPVEKEIVHPSDLEMSSSQYQHAHRLCGRVVSAVFLGDWSSPTSAVKFRIDAYVNEITSRAPDTGPFVSLEESQLDNAGFSLDHPPKFDDGRMIAYRITRKIQRAVIKFATETGMTQGPLRLTKGMVRHSSRTGNL